MNLKLTLTLDPDKGEQLVGLVAKAYGRGELGISGLLIEREGEVVALSVPPPTLRAIKQSTVAKLVAARTKRTASAATLAAAKLRASNAHPGMRAMSSGKPNSISTILRGIKLEGSRDGIGAMLSAHGFDPKGMSPALTKLQRRGYIERVGTGEYRLTPQGEELEGKINAKVEHHDSAKND